MNTPEKDRPPQRAKLNPDALIDLGGYLNSIGADGNGVVRSVNEKLKAGRTNELTPQLQALIKETGWRGNLWTDSVSAPTGKAAVLQKQPRPESKPIMAKPQGTSAWAELGKSAWNAVADVIPGVARTAQVLHSVKGTLDTGVSELLGFEAQDWQKTNAARQSQLFSDFVGAIDNISQEYTKFNEDKSGYYDQGLVSRDEDGFHMNSPSKAAHMIGNSLGFIGSMMAGNLAGSGVKAFTGLDKALKAAKAAGDVEKVASLTKQASKIGNVYRYITGLMTQVNPTYKDALEATGDADKAAMFTAVVTPVVAAIDAFTGGEAAIFGGRKQLTGKLAKEVLTEMAGKEITEEAIVGATKKVATSFLSKISSKARQGVIVGLEEGGTEVGQEGYTMMIESIFDKDDDEMDFSAKNPDSAARLLNAGTLGLMLGTATGTAVKSANNAGAYQPMAFRALHDAYKEGGQVGVDSQQERLQTSIGKMVNSGTMSDQDATRLSDQLNRMQGVITSVKNVYNAKPKALWQVYDLNYNQKTDLDTTAADLQLRAEGLQSDSPVSYETDENGRIQRDENGQPIISSYLDPSVVQMEKTSLDADILDNSRRRNYIDGVIQSITDKGNEIDYIKGLSVIGKFDINDTVQGKDQRSQSVSGRITGISDNGQELTIQTGTDTEGNPVTSVIRALDAKEYAPAMTPVSSAQASPDLVDGIIPHEDINAGGRGYQAGDLVVLADKPDDTVEVVSAEIKDGKTTLVVQDGDTQREVVVDGQGASIIGLYDPQMAISNAESRQQKNETVSQKEQLQKKLPSNIVKAIDKLTPNALYERWSSLEGVKGKESERSYLEVVAAEKGVDVYQQNDSQQTEDIPTPVEEPIDDAVWEEIGMSGVVPEAIANDIASRLLLNENLSERQQLILNDIDEAIRIGTILDGMALELLQADETIPQDSAPAGGAAATGDQTANGQDAAAGESTGQGADVQQPAGSAQPVMAQQPVELTGGTGTDSVAARETAQSGAQQSADSSAGITDPVSDDLRDRMIKGLVPGAEYDMNLFRLWPDQVAMGKPLSANQQAVLDAASPSEQARYAAALATARQSAAATQTTATPLAQVGQDVKVTLNSGTQTIGRIVSFEAGDAWVEHDDRRGKGKTQSRVGEGQVIDKATGEPLSIPKEQRVSNTAQAGKEALGRLITTLRNNFPTIEVALLTDQEMQELVGTSAYGAVKDGMVYINMDIANADTPIHEFAHLYAESLKKHYPNIYNRGLGLIKGSAYEQLVRENYPELTNEEDILEEALAQAIGERGAQIQSPSKLSQFVQWVKKVIRKIGEAIAVNLTSESTLDAFIDARTKELLSGQTMTELASEAEVTRLAKKAVLPPLPSLFPVMDEATLAAHQLDDTQLDALAPMDVVYNPDTDTYTREEVDTVEETNAIADNIKRIIESNALTRTLSTHFNVLDVANIGRVLFGDSEFGQKWQNMLEAGRRRISPMKIAAHDFTQQAYDALTGRTLYRGMTSLESVDRWTIDAELNGTDTQVQITPDIAMSIAGQYRTMMADYGHFDPEHKEKIAAGQEPQMEVMTVDLNDPSKQIVIRLNDAQLRDLSDMVFYQDQATADLMDQFEQHTEQVFEPVSRMYTIMNSGQLPKSNWYYPISSTATERELNQRKVQRFVDDASQLRARQKAPKQIRAYGFLSDINRYHHDAETYVQFAPLWQNIDKLLVRQEGNLVNMDMKKLADSLNKLRDAFATPDANRDAMKFSGWMAIDLGKLMQLATLSRFAFNIAIPIKQITGYFSAYGSGAIDAKYLTQELPNYMKMIGESYALVARGSREGNYTGGSTSFDEGIAELRSIDDSAAQNMLWRVLGSGTPEVQFDDFSSMKDVASGRAMIAGRLQAFFEEYGLAATHRADVAVVMALYNAAKRQVAETNGSLPYDEQQKMAARMAKEALYYSNNTYDQTDRAGIQLNSNMFTQMLLLYKSHNMKIYNTLARRAIEYAQADKSDQNAVAEARRNLMGNMALNAILAPVITTLINYGVKGLRDLSKDDTNKNDKPEEVAWEVFFSTMAQVAQVLPAELGEIGTYIMSKIANPDAPRELLDVSPFNVISDFIAAGYDLFQAEVLNKYRNRVAFEKYRTRALQQALRATATVTGTPMEIVRQLNNLLGNWMTPKPKMTRFRMRRELTPAQRGYDFDLLK